MIPDHDFDDYRQRRVLVMGLGSFGGGLGRSSFLSLAEPWSPSPICVHWKS